MLSRHRGSALRTQRASLRAILMVVCLSAQSALGTRTIDCLDLHVAIDRALTRSGLVGQDCTPREFQHAGYKPHATVTFGDVPVGAAALPRRVTAALEGWALYEYRGSLATSPARIVLSDYFEGP